MAIFGVSYPKVKRGTTEYELGKAIIEPSYAEPQLVEHKSIINSYRSWTVKGGDLASFRVIMNLFKYEDPRVIFEELYNNLNHQLVKLMVHEDSDLWVEDIDGNDADFFVTLMLPFYMQNSPPLLKDKLLIELKSQKPINLTGALYGYLWGTVGGTSQEGYLVDGGGDKLKIYKGAVGGGIVAPEEAKKRQVDDDLNISEDVTVFIPVLTADVSEAINVSDPLDSEWVKIV